MPSRAQLYSVVKWQAAESISSELIIVLTPSRDHPVYFLPARAFFFTKRQMNTTLSVYLCAEPEFSAEAPKLSLLLYL